MSNDMNHPTGRPTTDRPAPADRPTATFPTGWRGCPSAYIAAGDPRLVEADATPTVTLPTRPPAQPQPASPFPAVGAEHEHERQHEHEGGRRTAAARTAAARTERRERLARRASRRAPRREALRRHLKSALAAVALAAIVLTGMQLYAAAGITSARQAALAARDGGAAPAASATSTMSGQTAAWVTQDTHAPYSVTDPSATPLDLPRCTTAPDTPMPCLAHLHTSPSGAPDRVVTLEEDGSLTAFVPR